MKFLVRLIVIATLPFLIACEGNTDYSWVVKNDSSQIITLHGTGLFYGDTITETIVANTEVEVAVFSQLGGNSTIQDPDSYFGEALITNANGDTATKHFLIQSNWTSDIEERSKIPSDYQHRYEFALTDADF